jgi:hypothetical protein
MMMRQAALLALCFVACLLSMAHPCHAQTDFDVRNKEGLSRNPVRLTLLLKPEDERHTFHLFETIPIELEFSSSRPSTYSIELDETMNFAGATHTFEVEPEITVLLTWLEWASHGVVCCDSRRRYLSQQPTVVKRELTDYLRFEKAGTYRVFFTTRRVFKGPGKYMDFAASKMLLTSNILTLTILPDDPEWDAQRLAETLQTLHDPHVRANYRALEQKISKIKPETARYFAFANRLSHTEFAQAQKALNALDTEDAIRERVQNMEMMSQEELMSERKFGGGVLMYQPLLASTTRPDLVVTAMEARAEDPALGVDYDYVDWWARHIVLRDHIELFRFPFDDAGRQNRFHSFLEDEVAVKKDIVLRLESLLASKTGVAKEVTTLTIKAVKADIAYQTKDKAQTSANQ